MFQKKPTVKGKPVMLSGSSVKAAPMQLRRHGRRARGPKICLLPCAETVRASQRDITKSCRGALPWFTVHGLLLGRGHSCLIMYMCSPWRSLMLCGPLLNKPRAKAKEKGNRRLCTQGRTRRITKTLVLAEGHGSWTCYVKTLRAPPPPQSWTGR